MRIKKKTKKGIVFAVCFSLLLAITGILFVNNSVSTVEAATIKLNKKKITVKVGKNYQLKLKGTKKKAKWSSSNKTVAAVNAKGKVTAKTPGKVKVTAKIGKARYTCLVTVPKIKARSMKVYFMNDYDEYEQISSDEDLLVENGGSCQMKVSLSPSDSTSKVFWHSSDTDIFTVSKKGRITAKSTGYATLTVSTPEIERNIKIWILDTGSDPSFTTSIISEYTSYTNKIEIELYNWGNEDLEFDRLFFLIYPEGGTEYYVRAYPSDGTRNLSELTIPAGSYATFYVASSDYFEITPDIHAVTECKYKGSYYYVHMYMNESYAAYYAE